MFPNILFFPIDIPNSMDKKEPTFYTILYYTMIA